MSALRRASEAPGQLEFSWFGTPWFDESWEEAFAAIGGTSVDLDAALSSFQRRLLLTNAVAISGEEGSGEVAAGTKAPTPNHGPAEQRKGRADIPVAFAYERNRQLDEMRFAMLRVLELVDGYQADQVGREQGTPTGKGKRPLPMDQSPILDWIEWDGPPPESGMCGHGVEFHDKNRGQTE